MKITIRTNPEIVIDVDSAEEEKKQEEKKVEPVVVIPAAKTVHDVQLEPKAKTEKRGKGVRHCKKCKETGHRSDNCPNGAGGTIAENIQNLKDEGLSSDEIADRLGLSLTVVNKYW